jgi:DNA-binding transcriptional regulator YiaG
MSIAAAADCRYADPVISPAQVRAARALVKMKQSDLASAADVGLQTLKNYELEASDPRGSTLKKLELAFRAVGVVFLDADAEGGPGVRLAR